MIKKVHSLPFVESTPDSRALFQQWLHDMEFGGEQNPSTFIRTLLGDHIYNSAYREGSDSEGDWHRFCAEDIPVADDWLENGYFDSRFQVAVLVLINTAAFGRTFFVTEEGAMGLCPPTAKPGDEIWIFFGGNAPFTVRPLNGDDEGSTSSLRIAI
jgi:hypothetical protein